MNDDLGGVCIVTQPGDGQSEKNHTRDLARIIGELTSVAVLTANLSVESKLRDQQEVVEFSTKSFSDNAFVEALWFLRNQVRLCQEIQRREEAIMLFFGTTSYFLPILFARLLGKQVAVLPRGNIPLSLRLRWEQRLPDIIARCLAGTVSLLERMNYRLAHGIITYTPAMAKTLGVDQYKQKLYPMGARFVDTDRFDIEIPYEQRGRTVGFIGRLVAEKRIPLLIDVVSQLPDDIRVLFVGDGNYREQIEQQLTDKLKMGRVEVVGWVDHNEVPTQLNRMQLLLLPSKTEGLPTTVLEAMACGTPAYATPVSGVPDVVREGDTGFLMEHTDTDTVADSIIRILGRGDLSGISAAGRQLVEEQYSFEAAVDRYRTILTRISTTE